MCMCVMCTCVFYMTKLQHTFSGLVAFEICLEFGEGSERASEQADSKYKQGCMDAQNVTDQISRVESMRWYSGSSC